MNREYIKKYGKLLIGFGLKERVTKGLRQLIHQNWIEVTPSSLMVYMMDGLVSNHPAFFPVVFNPTKKGINEFSKNLGVNPEEEGIFGMFEIENLWMKHSNESFLQILERFRNGERYK